jgi:hypothetical protein
MIARSWNALLLLGLLVAQTVLAAPMDAEAKLRTAIQQAGGKIDEVERDGKVFWKLKFDELSDTRATALKGAELVISLEVFDASKLTDKGLGVVKYFPKLQELNLYKPKLTGSGIGVLKSNPELKMLVIGEAPKLGDQIADPLKSLTKLEVIDLNGSMISDRTLMVLKGLPELYELNLSNTKVKNAGLKTLVDMPKLKTLQAIGCGMDVATEKVLVEKFPKLSIRR